jgi:hypothetical protein
MGRKVLGATRIKKVYAIPAEAPLSTSPACVRGDHDRFVNSVLNGNSQMPPWRGVLDMEQIESIWSFSGDCGSLKM